MYCNINHRPRQLAAGITAISLLCLAGAAAAQADEPAPPTGWSGNLGMGAVDQATYLGSPNRRTVGVPFIELSYTTEHLGSFQLGQQGAAWIFPEMAGFTVGVQLAVDPGRYERRHDGLMPYGDVRLAGMGNVKSSAEAGVLLGYGPVSLSVRQSLGSKGHEGLVADLGIEHSLQVSERLAVSASAGARWSDDDYMQSFFGVTDAQATASRFDAYSAGKGVNSAQATVMAEYQVRENWYAMLGVNYSQLLGDAKDSPISEKNGSATGFVGLTWKFD
jgi:outer membrane scaffolding protein for murein synthesis (MipA/OmpV family)